MLAGGEGERQLDYWRGALRDVPPARAAGRSSAGRHTHAASARACGGCPTRSRPTCGNSRARRAGNGLHGAAGWARRMAVAPDRRNGRRRRGAGRASPAPGNARAARAVPEYGRAACKWRRRCRSVRSSMRRARRRSMRSRTSDVPFERVVDAVKPPVKRGDEWLRVKFAQQFDARHDSVLPGATAVATPGLTSPHASISPWISPTMRTASNWSRPMRPTASTPTPRGRGSTAARRSSVRPHAIRAKRRPYCRATQRPLAPAARRPCALRIEHADIVAAFARQAAAYPHRIALADASASLTFAELDDASNRIARALTQRGVAAEASVIVRIERSARFVVGLLGALKAGALAVLLDPAQPAARLAAAAADCGARWALVADPAAWPAGIDAQPLDVDAIAQDATLAHATGVRIAPHPEQGAYLIYTSGSTGTPKGVVVSHGALADYVQGCSTNSRSPRTRRSRWCRPSRPTSATRRCSVRWRGPHAAPAAGRLRVRSRPVRRRNAPPRRRRAEDRAEPPAGAARCTCAADVLPRHALVTGGETLTGARRAPYRAGARLPRDQPLRADRSDRRRDRLRHGVDRRRCARSGERRAARPAAAECARAGARRVRRVRAGRCDGRAVPGAGRASRAATWGVRRRPPSASCPIRSRPVRGCIAPATARLRADGRLMFLGRIDDQAEDSRLSRRTRRGECGGARPARSRRPRRSRSNTTAACGSRRSS